VMPVRHGSAHRAEPGLGGRRPPCGWPSRRGRSIRPDRGRAAPRTSPARLLSRPPVPASMPPEDAHRPPVPVGTPCPPRAAHGAVQDDLRTRLGEARDQGMRFGAPRGMTATRPHSSLGYRPPAPTSFPDPAFRLPMTATMQQPRSWPGPKYEPGQTRAPIPRRRQPRRPRSGRGATARIRPHDGPCNLRSGEARGATGEDMVVGPAGLEPATRP
jgi:hypothetical protein